MDGKFVGSFEHALDPKSRLTLPTRFREPFQGRSYLTPNREGCLALWTNAEFERETELLASRVEGSDGRNELRWWSSNAFEVTADRQGRMVIPAVLRTLANLENEVLIVGALNRVELWNPTVWNEQVGPAQAGWSFGAH